MSDVSWNNVYEKCRNIWSVYHSMTDIDEKKRFDKAMGAMMEVVIRIHGFVAEKGI